MAAMKRLHEAVDAADDALWDSVITSYPEAEHGDLSPENTIGLREALNNAVTEWVGNNVPAPKPDEDEEIKEFEYQTVRQVELCYDKMRDGCDSLSILITTAFGASTRDTRITLLSDNPIPVFFK